MAQSIAFSINIRLFVSRIASYGYEWKLVRCNKNNLVSLWKFNHCTVFLLQIHRALALMVHTVETQALHILEALSSVIQTYDSDNVKQVPKGACFFLIFSIVFGALHVAKVEEYCMSSCARCASFTSLLYQQRVSVYVGEYLSSTELTIEKCAATCDDPRNEETYDYFGVQWGKECYCGKSDDEYGKYGHSGEYVSF